MPIIPSTPKLRRFGLVQNGIVLQILGFFFNEKRRKLKKKKKKKEEEGRNRAGQPPHTGRMGVAEATLGLWGWSGHLERPKKKKRGLGF
jgi:hypothetical protein